ncbi:putative histone-lysine N-methyltransferase ATXR3 [Hordeum vulgare]|nr:putative histone-lysine N-methyltransferase ATXR3 [Hordeum vulgare]
MIALSATDDVAILEYNAVVKEEAIEGVQLQEEDETTSRNPTLVGKRWSWTETFLCTPEPMRGAAWSPFPTQEEVVPAPMQAPQAMAPAWQGPLAHMWQPPPYIDLTNDEDDDNTDN